MDIQKHIIPYKRWKQNPVERALMNMDTNAGAGKESIKTSEFTGLVRFLKSKYGIHGVKPVANIICNKFLFGEDKDGRRLFIKTGSHSGIYENEYRMGMALYEINPNHFMKPLYYNDYDKYQFFANEYVKGVSLNTAIMNGAVSVEQKAHLVGDIWRIFCALRASDVVHRDVRPDNLMIIDGRLVLIDFQLAVSKSNYVELEYLANRSNRLRKLGHKKYRYRPFTWDDAYSLVRVLEFIGRDKFYATRYDVIYKNIKAYIGTDKIKSTVRENDIRRMVRHIRQMRI